jgi:8-oxo-dGTP pyrophosphatase MutT (NUDIX family)
MMRNRSMLETALRESREEIGHQKADVEILGEMDDAATLTSFYQHRPLRGLIPYPMISLSDTFEWRRSSRCRWMNLCIRR